MKVRASREIEEQFDVDPMSGVLVSIYNGPVYSASPKWYGSVVMTTDSPDDHGIPGAIHPPSQPAWWTIIAHTRKEAEDEAADLLGKIFAARVKRLNLLGRAVAGRDGYIDVGKTS